MKVLVVHADYLEPGGETVSAAAEAHALRAAGHEVLEHSRSNREFLEVGAVKRAADLVYNLDSRRELAQVCAEFRPDVVHCNNLFPSLSPSVYDAARDSGAAVVQSLRNYRYSCPAATFFRDGAPCYDCQGKVLAVPGVQHGCYRGSRSQSAGVAAMTAVHRTRGTWRRKVDAFIVLSERARVLLSRAGLPADRVHVKFNVVSPEPDLGDGSGDFAVFASRLTPEKGVRQVLEAAQRSVLPVHVVGDGALAEEVRDAAERGVVRWTAQLPHAELLALMGRARATLAAPAWEEPFGRTVAESLGVGTPLVVTPRGALPELVTHGREGLHVPVDDAAAMAQALDALAAADDVRYAAWRAAARARYESVLAPDANVRRLVEVYEAAVRHRERTA